MENISVIADSLNIGILTSVLVTSIWTLKQINNKCQSVIEENKRKSSFEYLINISLGRLMELRKELDLIGISPYVKNANYLTDRDKLYNPDTGINDTRLIREILNIFDLICIGINYGVIDEDIVDAQLSVLMNAYWQWGKPFILLGRMLEIGSSAPSEYNKGKGYIEFENYIYKWHIREQKKNMSKNEWREKWQVEKIYGWDKKDSEKEIPLNEWVIKLYEKEYN